MGILKNKENKRMFIIIGGIIIIAFVTIAIKYIYDLNKKYKTATENNYNMAFYELATYVENVEAYLAKAMISTSAEHGAETLTNVWREAGLAQTYLSQLPLTNTEIGNTSKFLNQISDYSYSLSRKNIEGEKLTQEDLDNIKQLHDYTVELENTLNQLTADLNDGKIKWSDLTKMDTVAYATEVSSITSDSFSNLEKNFHEYSGLIYDGAFSEHITSMEKKGLTGDDIDEEKAKEIAKKLYGEENIEEIKDTIYSENADIVSYDMTVKLKDIEETGIISVSKKGGHVIFANFNKKVETEILKQEEADDIGKKFLDNNGFSNMKETYYLKENGIVTINYAYSQISEDGELVVMYPDLIKLKIALDDGKILGIETTGYLNSHFVREDLNTEISKEEARKFINPNLEILSENLAIIPTEWKTEVLCWEFKGKVDGTEFLVYINAKTGDEQDILMIVNTPNGTLTH